MNLRPSVNRTASRGATITKDPAAEGGFPGRIRLGRFEFALRMFYAGLVLALSSGCAHLAGSGRSQPMPSAGPTVTREQVMEMAEAYAQHRWRATQANIFHGFDPEGVRVDTPDARWWGPGGWYADGRINVGLPYCWGGNSTIEGFDEGLEAGRPAGYHFKKINRQEVKDPPDSALPIGVDCSGFVSRCWQLYGRRSTYDIAGVCRPLRSYDDLLPGDALNKPYDHVILFAGWADARHERMRVFEAGDAHKNNRPENYERVHPDVYGRAWLEKRGFVALRYRNILEQ